MGDVSQSASHTLLLWLESESVALREARVAHGQNRDGVPERARSLGR